MSTSGEPVPTPTRRATLPKKVELALKRALDVLFSLLVLVCGLPLYALLALLVRFTSPGPVLFVQERVGRGGRPFRIYKFRTMTAPSTPRQATVWTVADEARITPAGRVMRDYGLDELPQVFNILKGDMSIVGPRPPLPAQLPEYTERERLAFSVRPGVLSLAAVKGRRSLTMEERRELHAWYAQHPSLCLDAKILVQSLLVVVKREYATEQLSQEDSLTH